MKHFSNVFEKGTQKSKMIREFKGTGAAGGIGYALKVLFNA